jgi:hypothetical protein
MKVRAIRNSYADAPPHVLRGASSRTQTHLTVGKEYEVYTISFYQGCLYLLVIVDHGDESFRPSWFFEIVDRTVPKDWQVNLFDDGDLLQGLVGPEFIVRDGESYNALVEMEPEAVEKMVKYVLKSKKEAESEDS